MPPDADAVFNKVAEVLYGISSIDFWLRYYNSNVQNGITFSDQLMMTLSADDCVIKISVATASPILNAEQEIDFTIQLLPRWGAGEYSVALSDNIFGPNHWGWYSGLRDAHGRNFDWRPFDCSGSVHRHIKGSVKPSVSHFVISQTPQVDDEIEDLPA